MTASTLGPGLNATDQLLDAGAVRRGRRAAGGAPAIKYSVSVNHNVRTWAHHRFVCCSPCVTFPKEGGRCSLTSLNTCATSEGAKPAAREGSGRPIRAPLARPNQAEYRLPRRVPHF